MAFIVIANTVYCIMGIVWLHNRPQPRMAGYELPHE
jgi:hypothetical protein